MNYNLVTKTLLCTLVFLQWGCVNRVTMGTTNIKAIDLAIACKHDEALTEVVKLETSDIEGYRRMSYVIKAAIYLDHNQVAQSDDVAAKFYSMNAAAGEELDEEEKAQFKKDAECFKHYFEEERADSDAPAQCPVDKQVSQAF